MLFQVPDNVTAVSVEGIEFKADENGLINAAGCSGLVLRKLEAEARCVPAIGSSAAYGVDNRRLRDADRRKFRMPSGVGGVSVEGVEFQADKDGCFIVDDCSALMAEKLIGEAGCIRERLPPHTPEKLAEKDILQQRLADVGVPIDKRVSTARLRALLAEHLGQDKVPKPRAPAAADVAGARVASHLLADVRAFEDAPAQEAAD